MGLSARNVSKSFGEKKAVDNLSFEIPESEIFGLIGTNGAGKTTTIRMILGVMEKDAGEILWNGNPLRRDVARVGYMPEERGLYAKVGVLEQLLYFGALRGMSKKDATHSAERWLERLGVLEYRGRLAETLSKGNQQKIQLIVSLLHDPELLVLDEPFSGLDPINADVFSEVLNELKNAGKYIILSSHQMATVEQYCKSIVLLNEGKTLLAGNLNQIKEGYGHTNLSIITGAEILPAAEKNGLRLTGKDGGSYEFAINGIDMAHNFLKGLFAENIYPEKYEMRRPTLHEIFVSHVKEGGERE